MGAGGTMGRAPDGKGTEKASKQNASGATFSDLLDKNWKFWVLIAAILAAGWGGKYVFDGAIKDSVNEAIAPIHEDLKSQSGHLTQIDNKLDKIDQTLSGNAATLARLDERTKAREAKQ